MPGVPRMAACSKGPPRCQPRATRARYLYDCRRDEVSLNEVERIVI
jgi:hypothetical protein